MSEQPFEVFEVVVVGSLNMDVVVRTPRYPQAGETLTGLSWATFRGGKGYNQALAAARAGGRVALVGRVGADSFGTEFVDSFGPDGLDGRYIERASDTPTGLANILVEPDGTNRIVIVPGANATLLTAPVEAARQVFQGVKVLLLQLETPLESGLAAARLAKEAGALVLLTPAPVPAEPLPPEFLKLVDLLLPNEIEVFDLAGLTPGKTSYNEAASQLLRLGVGAVAVTLGAQGALYLSGAEEIHSPAFPVEVVDTTAAGDAFTGALAVALAQGLPLPQALRRANAAGAIACTRPGSGASLPTAHEIEALLNSEGKGKI